MTKSEIFKAAHKLAKTFEGNYRACFSLALREVLATSKETKMYITEEAKELISRFQNPNLGNAFKKLETLITEEFASADGDFTEAIGNLKGTIEAKSRAIFFVVDGKMIVIGKTFPIKEELQELGFKFSGNCGGYFVR